MSLLSAGVLKLHADPLGLPIGCQTWPVREMIAKDFPGTLKQLAAAGFKSIEMCSPVGYDDNGFGGLVKYKGAELKKIINDAGLTCVSSHFGLDELRKNQDDRIAWATDLGLTQMLVASLDGPKKPTMDDVKRAADEYNKMGEKAAKAGIQQGLHNETFETSTVDGKRTYDILFELLDPKARQISVPGLHHQRGLRRRRIFHTSTRADSFPCTCKGGPPRRRRSCPSEKARSTGRRSSPRPRPAASRTTSSR